MKNAKVIAGALAAGLLAACLLVAGCTQAPQSQGAVYTYDESNNGETYRIAEDSTIVIKLDENPTTGYSWNITSTEGLVILIDEYKAPDTNLVGAGGMHTWELIPSGTANAVFSAIYKRPWEETTGNETSYTLSFIIE
jgi:inhibitor of cysteine peptidase